MTIGRTNPHCPISLTLPAKPAVQSQKAIPPGHSSGAAVTHHYSHARSPTEAPRPRTPSMPTDDAEGLPKSMPIRNLRQHSASESELRSCIPDPNATPENREEMSKGAGAGLRYTPVGIWRVGIIEQQESDSQRVLSSGSIP